MAVFWPESSQKNVFIQSKVKISKFEDHEWVYETIFLKKIKFNFKLQIKNIAPKLQKAMSESWNHSKKKEFVIFQTMLFRENSEELEP